MAETRRIQVIANPVAGRPVGGRTLHELCGRMRKAGHGVTVHHTAAAGDARAIAARSGREATDVLVVAGGDGTISEVVGGPPGPGVRILIVPVGTENILARYFGIELDVDLLWQAFEEGREVHLDVARRDGRRFLIVAGIGVDGEIVRLLSNRRRGHISYWSYVAPIWQVLGSYKIPTFTVEADGRLVHEGPGWALVGGLPRYGMGTRLLSRARPDDGRLDLCVFQCAGKARLLWLLLRVLLQQHTDCEEVVYRKAQTVRIRSNGPVPVQIDGDFDGWLPAVFDLAPEKARFLVPSGWAPPGSPGEA